MSRNNAAQGQIDQGTSRGAGKAERRPPIPPARYRGRPWPKLVDRSVQHWADCTCHRGCTVCSRAPLLVAITLYRVRRSGLESTRTLSTDVVVER